MLFWIIQQIIVSVVLIISIHYIYLFFKNNLTVPKTKDLVKKPTEQYKKIYTTLGNKKDDKEDKEHMKSELLTYLKQISKKDQKNTKQTNTKIESAGNIFGSSSNFTVL